MINRCLLGIPQSPKLYPPKWTSRVSEYTPQLEGSAPLNELDRPLRGAGRPVFIAIRSSAQGIGKSLVGRLMPRQPMSLVYVGLRRISKREGCPYEGMSKRVLQVSAMREHRNCR